MKSKIFKSLLLIAICYLPVAAFAQGFRYDGVALLDTGRPVQGATITVCASGSTGTPCTPTTSIFSDSALSVGITQPGFQSGAQGNFNFYAACGKYDISFTGNGLTSRTMKDVQLGQCTRMTWSVWLPSGSQGLANQPFNSVTPGKAITVTRITGYIVSAVTGCSTQPTFQVTDGSNTATLTLPNGSFNLDSGAVSVNFAAGAVINLRSGVVGIGCGGGGNNANNLGLTVQYTMQQ